MRRGAFLAVLVCLRLTACAREPPPVTVTVVDPVAPPTRMPTLVTVTVVDPTRMPTLVTVTGVDPVPPPTRTPPPSVPATPSAQPRPTATASPIAPAEPTPTPSTVRVGSAGGQPIYLYNSPTVGDRIQSYPESTPLVVIGSDVEGDGLTWHIVRAPDGTEGYIPVGETLPEP